MRRKALQLLAISCLVALAGCSGALTGDGGAGEQSLEDVSYPAGVSENGTNVSALGESHTEALNGSSFALGLDVNQSSSQSNRSTALRAAVGPNRDNVRMNVSDTKRAMELYTTAEQRYLRIGTDGDATYQTSERTSDGTSLVPSSYSGASYLDRFAGQVGANFTPTGVRDVDGTTVVVLRADGSDVSAPDGTNVTDYNATILVDEQGVVHRFEASIRTGRDDAASRISVTMTVSDVGETAVEEPTWLDEAHNQTSN
ncbi:DUF7537 family lipoprotein [Halorussus salinisoli]|uniref:DUF7537 family lipoprotein n=1 Tax=Halorussus salinisoli TaxID=2558242 RepID=UPI0010C20133|nr:hypothetical protein [Halorussus salinisoli]